MAQPYELKFTISTGDVVTGLRALVDGVAQVGSAAAAINDTAKTAADGITAISTAATENAGAIAGMASAVEASTESLTGMASAVDSVVVAEQSEAAELARLTELLGSEASARASMTAQIIDQTVAQTSSVTATTATVQVTAEATTSTRSYNEAMSASAMAAMAEGQAQSAVAERVEARIAGLRRFTEAELAARRAQQATAEGIAAFSSKTQEWGSMLTMLGLVNPQLLRAGVGIQMLGQAAETLGPKIVEAGGGVSGFVSVLGPIVGIGAAVAGALGAMALAAEGLKAAFEAALPEQESETSFAILLGNVEKADERLAELDQTALKFHLDPEALRNASESLTRLSQGALGSGQSLNTVIEMAARTHQPLEAMGAILGRLYETIESGQPIARMGTQLVRLGLLSASDVNALNNLHKEGAKGPQVWAAAEAALNKYSGAAAARANTFQGATRGISAAWNEVLAAFGKPIVDLITPYVQKVASFLATLVPVAVQVGRAFIVMVQDVADGFVLLTQIITGNFSGAMATVTRMLGRTSALIAATCKLIAADVAELIATVEAGLASMASSVLSSLVKTFGDALAATDNFVASMVKKMSFLPGAVQGGIVGALGGGSEQGTDLTSGIMGGIAGVAKASSAAKDQAVADAAKAEAAWKDVLKGSQPAAPNAGTQFPPVTPGAIVEPDSKAGKSGVGGRKQAVDEGAEAEKQYRMQLDLTKEALGVGDLSQTQADEQNAKTIADYIAHLNQLQAKLDPTSDKFKELEVRILDAGQALQKVKEGQDEYQNALELTKAQLDAGTISQAQADAQDNATIRAYIVRLQALQATLAPTSAKFQELETKVQKANAALQKTTALGQITSTFKKVINAWGDLGKNASEWLSTSMNSGISAVSQGLTGLITKTGNWKQTFISAIDSMLEGLIELGVKTIAHYALMGILQLANAALGKTTTQSVVATQESAGASIAAAHAPAAAATSVSSYGVAAIVGAALAIAAIGAIIALLATGAFAEGGLIPGAPSHRDNRIAQVATGEYIVRASAVQRYGPELLHAINNSTFPLTMPAYAAGGMVGGGQVVMMGGGSGGGSRVPDVNVGGARVTLIQPHTRFAMHEAMRSAEGDAIILDAIQRKKHLMPFKRR